MPSRSGARRKIFLAALLSFVVINAVAAIAVRSVLRRNEESGAARAAGSAGVEDDAVRQHRLAGLDAMERGDYETAIHELTDAARAGDHSPELLRLLSLAQDFRSRSAIAGGPAAAPSGAVAEEVRELIGAARERAPRAGGGRRRGPDERERAEPRVVASSAPRDAPIRVAGTGETARATSASGTPSSPAAPAASGTGTAAGSAGATGAGSAGATGPSPSASAPGPSTGPAGSQIQSTPSPEATPSPAAAPASERAEVAASARSAPTSTTSTAAASTAAARPIATAPVPELRPSGPSGDIEVLSPNVPGEVWVNGRSHGLAPRVVREIPVGSARVEIRVDGVVRRSRAVQVREGQRARVSLL
jgi:hypothetical protein